jgi:hypothetical protein
VHAKRADSRRPFAHAAASHWSRLLARGSEHLAFTLPRRRFRKWSGEPPDRLRFASGPVSITRRSVRLNLPARQGLPLPQTMPPNGSRVPRAVSPTPCQRFETSAPRSPAAFRRTGFARDSHCSVAAAGFEPAASRL